MPIRDDHLNALRAFRAIAAHGSFTQAAVQLEVTPSALSQTMRQLEERLGVRLLQRTTRHVGLSEAGRAMLQRVTPALEEIDAAIEDVHRRRDRPSGTLRVTVPQVALIALIEPHLAEFLRMYPDLHLDILVDSALNDLVAENLDAGIRLGEKVQRDMVALPLGGAQRSVVVGSPAYFAAHGVPATPRDLQQHNCLRFRFGVPGRVYRWEFAHKNGPQRGRWFEIGAEGNLTANDISTMIRAAQDGVGLIHTMEIFVREPLASKRLVSVLDAWLPPYDGFYLYYPSRRQVPPKLRVFADFLRAKLAAPAQAPRNRRSTAAR
jgi:DNA-binding transcriptional LysR family regulator